MKMLLLITVLFLGSGAWELKGYKVGEVIPRGHLESYIGYTEYITRTEGTTLGGVAGAIHICTMTDGTIASVVFTSAWPMTTKEIMAWREGLGKKYGVVLELRETILFAEVDSLTDVGIIIEERPTVVLSISKLQKEWQAQYDAHQDYKEAEKVNTIMGDF